MKLGFASKRIYLTKQEIKEEGYLVEAGVATVWVTMRNTWPTHFKTKNLEKSYTFPLANVLKSETPTEWKNFTL